MDEHCTFCRIVANKSGAYVVYEDDDCMAFLGEHPDSSSTLERSLL